MSIGPWGDVGDVLIGLVPIVFLLVLILKPNPTPATTSLPLSAVLMWVLRLLYFESDPNLINAAALEGIMSALTPVSIAFGAVVLFQVMHYTRCLGWLISQMKTLSRGNPVAEIMIIGWCFTWIVEGAAGFGTPAALGAPILVSLGHDPVKVACVTLVMNAHENPFGAVGTGIFFGFSQTPGATDEALLEMGFKTSIINAICALVVPLIGVNIIVPWKVMKHSLLFIYLSIFSTTWVAIGFATFSFNFPTLVGGLVGLLITMTLSHYSIGLADKEDYFSGKSFDPQTSKKRTLSLMKDEDPTIALVTTPRESESSFQRMTSYVEDNINNMTDEELGIHKKLTLTYRAMDLNFKNAVLNTAPLWGSVLILVVTRIPQITLNTILNHDDTYPHASLRLGTLGTLDIGASLHIFLNDIFGDTSESSQFDFAVLNVPWFLPFVVMSVITYFMFKDRIDDENISLMSAFREGAQRIKNPAKALAGAAMLAALMTAGGDESPAFAIGTVVSNALKDGWVALSALLGGLGAFFAGSVTVSNLTFGPVQQAAAANLHVSETSMLALQLLGASAGNAIAIGNIVLVKAVMGGVDHVPEGVFIWINLPAFFVFILMITASGFVLIFVIE